MNIQITRFNCILFEIIFPCGSLYLIIKFIWFDLLYGFFPIVTPHRLGNGWHARLECSRSWVRAPVVSNQRLIKLVFVASQRSMQHVRRKSKDWLARNQDNVSEFEWHVYPLTVISESSTIKILLSVLVQYKADIIIISSNTTCSRHDTAGKLLIVIWC